MTTFSPEVCVMSVSARPRLIVAALLAALLSSTAQAQGPYYWDNNGTIAGFGTPASGTWDTAGSSLWNTLADGTGTVVNTTTLTTDAVNFGTAADGLGAGTITVATVSAGNITFGSASGAILFSGGTINLAAVSTITVDNATNTIGSILSGAGTSLTKAGTGILVLSGVNTYTGATAVKNGTLALGGGNNRLPTGTTVTLGDGTANTSGVLKLDGRSQQLGGLLTAGNGTGNRVVNGSATVATLTLSIASGTNTFGGILGGTGINENNFALTKSGGATLTLSGANTYTGSTTVVGTLTITGSINSAGGARLLVGSTGSNTGTVNFNTGHTTSTWGGSPFNFANYVGVDGSTGNLNANAGTVNFTGMVSGGGHLHVGANGGVSNGTVTVGGGIINVGTRMTMGVGYPGSDAANLVGNSGNGNATLTINSGAVNIGTGTSGNTDTGFLYLKSPTGGTGTATVNLNGGTLSLHKFQIGAGGTSKTINFNSGIVQARSNQASFLTAGATTNVTGGALFDTNGFSITVGSALLNAGAGGLTKLNTGTLTLTGANTYTGATTINGGTLALGSGGNLGATTVTANGSSTLAVVQTASATTNAIAGSIALNAGAAFTMADTFASTLEVTGASTLAPTSGNFTALTFDIVGAATDKLSISGAATVGAGGAKINVAPSTTAITPGDYTVISAASGLGASFTLANPLLPNAGGLYTLSLASSTSTAQVVTVVPDSNALYWKGTSSVDWNTPENWTTDQGGTTASGSAPGSTTNVVFSATGATNLTTNTLTAPLTVNSVNFLPGTGAVTVIASANALTINGGGITNGSANAMTVNNPIALGDSQTWTNTGVGLLTVGGSIDNGSNLLTIDGTGNTAISGLIGSGATKTGGLAMNGTGTLTLSSVSSAFTGNVSINSGTLKANGGNNSINPTRSPLGNPQTAGRTISVGRGAFLTFGGNDTLGNAGSTPVVKIIVNGGTIANGGAFFTTLGPVDLNAGTINSVGGVNATYPSFQLGGAITVGGSAASSINGGGTNSQMSLGIAYAANTSTTFNVADATGSSASDLNVSVVLQNGAGGTNGLIKTGVGTMTLTGANTYTGATTVSAGTLQLGATNAIASASPMTLAGGTFDLGGFSQGSAGVTGLGNLSVSATSTLSFGITSGANVVRYAGLGTHTASTVLLVTNYEGGSDRLYFAGTSDNFTAAYAQAEVSFNGTLGYSTIDFGTYYEVAPVPEPGTILGIAVVGMGLAGRVRRRYGEKA